MNHIPTGLSRRGVLGVAAGGALTAMLAACSNDSSSSKSSSSGTVSSGAAAGGKFPQTVKSVYGDVTVKEQPKRVVALVDAYADMCVALGVQPVALSFDEKALAPWAKGLFTGKLDGALEPETGKPSAERLAALHPDLIVGASYSTNKDLYPTISKIAPEYCGRVEGTGDWKMVLDDLSALLTGSTAKSAEVKKDLEKTMAGYKAKIKGLQGKTYQWVGADSKSLTFGDGTAFEALGLVPGPKQDGRSGTSISYENVDQLSADCIFFYDFDGKSRKKLESDPRFSELSASKNGTVLWASVDQANALQAACPSSFKYTADWAVPALEKSKLNTKG